MAATAAGRTPGDRRQCAVQRQFAENGETIERIRRDSTDRGHDAKRNGQIVMAAFLGHIRGRKIYGDALRRQRESGSDQRGANPFARFRDRLVAEPHNVENDRAAGDLNLDVDRAGLNALKGDCRNPYRHDSAPTLPKPEA